MKIRPYSATIVMLPAVMSGFLLAGCGGGASGEKVSVSHETDVVSSGSDIVIAEVYGGGPTGAFKDDYVVLFNRGTGPASLSGLAVQKAGVVTSFFKDFAVKVLPDAVLPAGGYYMVRGLPGAPDAKLPTPDTASANLGISDAGGKIALTRASALLDWCGGTDTARCSAESIVDLIGYGHSATLYNGSRPAEAMDDSTSLQRGRGGCLDTHDNGNDFKVLPAAPHNSSSPLNPCQ